MQFERLRKSHKKQIIIGAIAICVIGVVFTFATSRAFYRVDDSLDLAKGIINYKSYDFKIMAMYQQKEGSSCTEDSCYNELTGRMPSSGYMINEEKSYCTIDNVNKDTTAVLKTVEGNHIFNNLTKNDKCYLYFDKKIPEGQTSSSIIADIIVKDETPNFASAATLNEGVFKMTDPLYDNGTSYYWRGEATNNYVKFAGFCWRIIRINGDGSIRVIYDGKTCHANGTSTTESLAVTSQAYNPSRDRSEYVGYTFTQGSQRGTTTSSNLKSQIDTWYNSNIGNNTTYSSKVADGKFCNDRNAGSGYSWSSQTSTFYYAGYDRSGAKNSSSVTPTLSCPSGDVYTLKAGTITMDEVVMAGSGKYGTANSDYYLYNGQIYWTMSPYGTVWSSSTPYPISVFYVNSDGKISSTLVNNTYGVRPVINLRTDITFSDGDGTLNNPYIVAD